MRCIYLCEKEKEVRRVYADAQHGQLKALTGIGERVYTGADLAQAPLPGVEAVFSTWGMPSLTEEEIAQGLPDLQAVFYAAGSVQPFARPFLNRGVRVFSAWQANAVPVARYAAAQILLALKGYFRIQPACRQSRAQAQAMIGDYPGSYDAKVGLLGCGAIGRRVARLLQGMDLTVLAFDPFLPEEEARALGVRKAELSEVFASCAVVSNHLANLPATRGIITREMLLSMPPASTFINTGRGAQLREEDLYEALTADPSRTALLDVMNDEARSDASPLNALPNCLITPHIAGSSGHEVRRMADYMIEAFQAVSRGEACPHEVTLAMLETMA